MLVNVVGVLVDGTAPITAVPAPTNLVLYQGQDTIVQVTVTGSTGLPINLTGYAAALVLKDRLLPSTGQARTSSTYAASLTSPSTGVMQFTIPGIDLKNLQLVGYFWDVFVTSSTNKRDEVVPTGTLTVSAAVGA